MSSVYTLNCARFTVITEGIIRCEYSADETFVDAPTLLANRTGFSPCAGTVSDGCVTICTGKIRLSYTENGKPFEKENLSAQITCGDFCFYNARTRMTPAMLAISLSAGSPSGSSKSRMR